MIGSVVLIIFVLAVFAPVNGHNWLTAPLSRNGNVAYSGVPNNCDPGAPTFNGTYHVGDVVPIVWTSNHPGVADHYFALAAYDDPNDDSVEAAAPLIDISSTSTQSTGTVTLNVAPGRYTLQYRWETWRNCHDMTVYGNPPPAAQLVSGSSVLYNIPAGQYDASTGVTTCNSGYVPVSNGSCAVTFGRWIGVCFGLAILFVVVGAIAYVIFLKIKRPDELDQHISNIKNRISGNSAANDDAGSTPAGSDMP